MENINLGPTKLQMTKIAKGKTIILKHSQLSGDKTFKVSSSQVKTIQRARRLNKGVSFMLTPAQIGGNPFLLALAGFVAEKVVNGAVKGIGKLIKGKGHTGGGEGVGVGKKKRVMTAEQLENLRKGREKMIQNANRRTGNGLSLPGTNKGEGLILPRD